MATIPRILQPPPQPVVQSAPMYTLEQMAAFGWLNYQPIALPGGGFAIPRTPDPRIPAGEDPRIPRKEENA